jgi:inner membrane transporter RhtA
MNLCFYLALSRVPLAVAVTIELVGPLVVSAFGSRRLRHALWVLLAAAGVLGFAPLGALGCAVDPLGIGLALLSAFFCAMYILLSAGVGRACERGDGLALAMAVAAIALLPLGVVADGGLLLQPRLLIPAAGVALLCSVVPYSLEINALRRMPPRVFGVLVSLEPAFASLAGWIVLHERLSLRALVAIALVTLASVGAASSETVGI